MKGEIITLAEGAHSILGPSSSERWMNCPSSVLAPGIGKQTEYAACGTAAHSLSEWVRETGKPASEWKGTTIVVGDFQFKVGKTLIDSVTTFVEEVSAIPGAPLIEELVAYEDLVPGGFGTMDDGRLEDGLCTITDYKHGQGVQVSAKGNSQMRLYALGVWFKYRWIYDFDKFVLKICQPRLRHFEKDEISLGKLLQWGYDTIRPAAKLAMTPGAPIRAGSWCRFCKIKDTCQTRMDYKAEMKNRELNAETEFENLTEE